MRPWDPSKGTRSPDTTHSTGRRKRSYSQDNSSGNRCYNSRNLDNLLHMEVAMWNYTPSCSGPEVVIEGEQPYLSFQKGAVFKSAE